VRAPRWDERFFASTRGQVVGLLRRERRTVEELASALRLTDNAVRSHLAALERDGLVRQGEPRRGIGKPAFTYELTPAAERLFPKPYGTVLTELLDVLATRLPTETLGEALREVGHRVAAGQPAPGGEVAVRVEAARALLSGFGGLTDLEETDAGYVIHGWSCPFAAAVEGSPCACLMAETLLSDVIGCPVHHRCDPGPPPRCRFEIPVREP
jgi:predicted ArsR family transcriptional regulator